VNTTSATDTAFPLQLTIDKIGSGGVDGVAPTVALRDTLTGYYLDFADSTFKSGGWAVKNASMTPFGRGIYARAISWPALLGTTFPNTFSAEYHVDDGSVRGDDSELVRVNNVETDTTRVRKYHTNRLQEVSGNPGHLYLYDDDDTTLLATHELLDEAGGPIAPTVLTPARRSQGT